MSKCLKEYLSTGSAAKRMMCWGWQALKHNSRNYVFADMLATGVRCTQRNNQATSQALARNECAGMYEGKLHHSQQISSHQQRAGVCTYFDTLILHTKWGQVCWTAQQWRALVRMHAYTLILRTDCLQDAHLSNWEPKSLKIATVSWSAAQIVWTLGKCARAWMQRELTHATVLSSATQVVWGPSTFKTGYTCRVQSRMCVRLYTGQCHTERLL